MKNKISYHCFWLGLSFILFSCNTNSTSDLQSPRSYDFEGDSILILKILDDQQKSWNEGNIDGFMQGYWKSDSLTFISGNGVTYGWDQTLTNYKKGYPDRAAMGKLSFDIISINSLGKSSAQVIGKYTLERQNDQPQGHFCLIFQKKQNQWKLTSDMTANASKKK